MASQIGYAQQSEDSLQYYKQVIVKIQSSDDLKNAYTYFQKYLKASHTPIKKIEALFLISKIEYKQGFYDESELHAVKALQLLEQDNSKKGIWYKKVIYNQLGIIYKEKGMYPEALKNYNKALAITALAKDSLVMYNNIALTYKKLRKDSLAEAVLLDAVTIFPRVKSTKEKARVLNNLGGFKIKTNTTQALSYITHALQLRQQLKDSSDLYSSYKNLSLYYANIKDTVQAKNHAVKAYTIATLVNSMSYTIDALKLRLNLKDYTITDQYFKLKDSLDTANKQTRNSFALLKYDVNKKELEAQESLANSRLYKLITALIVAIGFALYFMLKSKHKKDKFREIYNTETRISKKVHDEVANDVYQIMTKLQTTTQVNDDVLDDLEGIYKKTRDISKENSTIDVNEDFEELLSDLLLSYKNENLTVITKNISKIEWNTITEIKKTTVYRVLQELMTNMKKHSQATIVVLVFNKNNKKLNINYKDNGIGCTLKKQNGLLNTENRIKSLNGTITFDSSTNNGFKAQVIV
ncbi:ATP-binding protein [Olleya sp. R77988]|uniref:ATP-binding protein n=1 Tax=Olleya sp. R77988 TaxID=3093875 RepID=UPI0037CBB4CC